MDKRPDFASWRICPCERLDPDRFRAAVMQERLGKHSTVRLTCIAVRYTMDAGVDAYRLCSPVRGRWQNRRAGQG